ncbi:MAG: ferredoxin [Proteobacteria bacterium]|nr:ferredoxin [Pseudomonadota bacterium]
MESFELLDKWLVRATRRHINISEALICRSGARFSIAEAEGFALLNQRAAALFSDKNNPDLTLPSMPSTLVCHRERKCADPLRIRLPFELQATSAQEAVYHCLIAHDVAARLGLPGLCTIDDRHAARLEGARMISREMLDAISPIGAKTRDILDDALILRTIEESFTRFQNRFGLPIASVEASHASPHGICILSSGRYIDEARALTGLLEKHNLCASYVCPKVMRPFPEKTVLDCLANQKIILILDETDTYEQSDFHAPLAQALSNRSFRYISMPSDDSIETIAETVGIDAQAVEDSITFTSPKEDRPLVIGAAPGGQMSRGLLFDLASYLEKSNGLSAFPVKCTHPQISALGLEKVHVEHSERENLPIDVLFLSHPGLLDIENILQPLSDHAIVLVLGRSVEEASIWPLFSPAMQTFIEKKQIGIYSLAGALIDEYSTIDRYGSYAVHGALLRLIQIHTGAQINSDEILQNRLISKDAYARLMTGMQEVREVDRSIQYSDRFDPYFAPQIKLPRMLPAVQNRSDASTWRTIIRNFFVRGQSSDAHHHPLPGLSIRPAALNPYLEALNQEHHYPLLATRISGNPSLQASRLDEALRQKFSTLPDDSTAERSLTSFLAYAEKISDDTLLITPARKLLDEALTASTTADPGFSPAIRSSIREFITALPDECYLIGLNTHTLLDLYVLAVRAARRSRIRDVRAEIRGLITQLRESLRLDDAYGPFGMSEDALRDAFGDAADGLLDIHEISKDLSHQHRGHVQHDPERISRMTASLDTLENFLKHLDSSDDLIFIYPPEVQVKTSYDRVRSICHEEPIAVATGLFDAISQKHVEAFKAMRMARLDIDNAYDPVFHADILEQFTWQDLSEDELRLLPVLCIAETTERIYAQLSPLSRIIRAGKPIVVLAFESTSQNTGNSKDHANYDPGFSYLATAFREAFVAQSSLARPEHLVKTLTRMNRMLRPAITVVACPTWSWRLPPRVQLEAAHYARTAPMFQYDPSIGETRVERFNVDENPQIDQVWPTCQFSYIDADGNIRQMSGTFTYAHALALEPGYHQYFRILPNDAWNDELVEIGEFLKSPSFDRPHIPFIWGVVDSTLRKCIMTRDVVNACIDRMQRWKTLRELSLSTKAQLQLAQDARTALHLKQLEASQKAVEQASMQYDASQEIIRKTAETLEQCLSSLHAHLGHPTASEPDFNEAIRDESAYIEGLAGEPPAQIAITATPAQDTHQSLVPTQSPQTQDARAASAEDKPRAPWLDSAKCLSCGACISLDDRTFGFNDDGQAVILRDDATPEDCRDAADTCPAGCIHCE